MRAGLPTPQTPRGVVELVSMSGKTKKKHVVLEREMIFSQAFRELKGAAKDVVLIFMAKRQMKSYGRQGKQRWIVENDGEINFTYGEAIEYGITARRFARALDEAVEKGFVDVAYSGLGVLNGVRDPSRFAISNRWRAYGTPDFVPASREKDMRSVGCRATGRRYVAPRKVGGA